MKKIIIAIVLSTSLFAEQKPEKSLVACAGDGNTNCVQYYIDHNYDLNASENGMTPLGAAVNNNRLQTVEQLLIVTNVSPNITFYIYPYNSRILTPIGRALSSENYAMAELLLKYGANLETVQLWQTGGMISPQRAYVHNKFVLDNRRNLNFDRDYPRDLYESIVNDDHSNIKLFVSKGANTNSVVDGEPVIVAAGGDFWIVKFLAEHGADINARDTKGHSALFWAISLGNRNTESYLVNKGATLTTKEKEELERIKNGIRTYNGKAIERRN